MAQILNRMRETGALASLRKHHHMDVGPEAAIRASRASHLAAVVHRCVTGVDRRVAGVDRGPAVMHRCPPAVVGAAAVVDSTSMVNTTSMVDAASMVARTVDTADTPAVVAHTPAALLPQEA